MHGQSTVTCEPEFRLYMAVIRCAFLRLASLLYSYCRLRCNDVTAPSRVRVIAAICQITPPSPPPPPQTINHITGREPARVRSSVRSYISRQRDGGGIGGGVENRQTGRGGEQKDEPLVGCHQQGTHERYAEQRSDGEAKQDWLSQPCNTL